MPQCGPNVRLLGRTKTSKCLFFFNGYREPHSPPHTLYKSRGNPSSEAKHLYRFITSRILNLDPFTPPTKPTQGLSSEAKMLSTLETLHEALNLRSIPCTFTGEDSSILSFTTTPLSYTLRIVGHKISTIVIVLDSRKDASIAFTVVSDEDFAAFCAWICDFQAEQEKNSVHGQLKPVPQSDAALLKLLQRNAPDCFNTFAPVEMMVQCGHLLNAVVTLFAPFGLKPDVSSADSVSFGVKHLVTNEYYAGPKITRFRERDSKATETRGNLNLSACVTLLYARSHGAAQAEADRKRMLSNKLVEAGYVGEQEEDDFMPQKVLLFDLSKAEDRTALVERILLMRDSERKGKAPFDQGRWMGKQKSNYREIGAAPCPGQRPAANAYHLRKEVGGRGGLRRELKEHDIDLGVDERTVKRDKRPPAGDENLLEWVLWKQQDRVNERLVKEQEDSRETAPEPTREEDEETVEPVTPPDSPPRDAFPKSLTDVGEDGIGDMGLNAGTLRELGY
ncbi:hypothetical protein PMIN03_011763 [Paraphaeosphaeria minitans]